MYSNHSPFGSKASSSLARSLAGAYAKVGTETGVIGADSHRLIAMLFDGLLESLQEARGAMERRDMKSKCDALSRAARIVEEGLNAGLAHDSGLEVAENLQILYGYLSVIITKANLRCSPELVDEALSLVTPVRQAWNAIAPSGRSVN